MEHPTQAPAAHVTAQAVAVPQPRQPLACLTQVSTPSPAHCVAPALHASVHCPPVPEELAVPLLALPPPIPDEEEVELLPPAPPMPEDEEPPMPEDEEPPMPEDEELLDPVGPPPPAPPSGWLPGSCSWVQAEAKRSAAQRGARRPTMVLTDDGMIDEASKETGTAEG
jgi:hypothetical protein